MNKRGPGVGKQNAFLEAFALTGSFTRAAQAAGCDRSRPYRWMKDPAFLQRFEEARELAVQALEDEAVRRAHEGVSRPLIYRGELVFKPLRDENGKIVRDPKSGRIAWSDEPYLETEYSDALLMFTLKSLRPDKYRERGSLELSGPKGGPIPLEQARLAVLSDDELAALTELARKLDAAPSPGSGNGAPAAK